MNKIVISRLDNIGDVVMTTPILYELKKKYPKSKVMLVIRPLAAQAVEGLPFIDEVIVFSKKNSIRQQIDIIRKIWHADLAYLIDYTHRIALLAFLAGIKMRVGIKHKREKLLTHPIEWKKKMDNIYDPLMFASLLKQSTGIDIMKDKDWNTFYFAEAAEKSKDRIKAELQSYNVDINKPYIVFSLYTSLAAKDWPEHYWAELWHRIGAKYDIPIVLTGSNSNKIKFDANVLDLSDKTNLKELGYVISKAALVIGGCSAPMHIARAFKVPTIGLYGPTPAAKGAPPENLASFVTSAECAPCNGDYSSPCKKPFCMGLIKVDDVYKVVADFLDQLD